MMKIDTSKAVSESEIVAAGAVGVAGLTTRHILSLYRLFRHRQTYYVYGKWYDYHPGVEDDPEYAMRKSAMRMLTDELSKRPHVLNKRDGSAARRVAAKRKR